jgi:hypothetical protein
MMVLFTRQMPSGPVVIEQFAKWLPIVEKANKNNSVCGGDKINAVGEQ